MIPRLPDIGTNDAGVVTLSVCENSTTWSAKGTDARPHAPQTAPSTERCLYASTSPARNSSRTVALLQGPWRQRKQRHPRCYDKSIVTISLLTSLGVVRKMTSRVDAVDRRPPLSL
jgi:hypothetical protein